MRRRLGGYTEQKHLRRSHAPGMITRVLILVFWSFATCFADLESVKAERNLEKRSEKAMKNAHAALDRAREISRHGDQTAESAALAEVGQSIELCKASLEQSGKNPRKSPKYFKRAEIEIRRLIRRLDNFRIDKSVDEREPIEKLIELSLHIHEELLAGILGKKARK